ncbi:hypothetical protein Acsp03_32550 [Actinomadura sp. NBRC 104412]|uniref:hypothetical protein n=1 Tax=Actinomadura sp. NBRC 104412 TaxID=3032203 RepID=UPI0024A1821D|nr:hypothetical protein [Actinomadura sp. NBRC 104412]GLZ05789.1 hypothetical protein Acsp03_32550 [Actinomadura sp. NBRC 104412]
MSIRHGFYATWHGTEYEASPDGSQVRLYSLSQSDGFTPVTPDRHVKVVHADDVDLTYVNTYCTWRGEKFVVLGEHKGWLRVEHADGQAPVAERLGLETFDRGVYQTWAKETEVEDLHEETA